MFSVIIPTYNSADKVINAINSVLAQSFAEFEIIVVDDGSADDTAQRIGQIVDERVKYYLKNNGGPASARNLGIGYAKFQYICFLDADDCFLPDKLQKTYNAIINNPGANFFFTDALYINKTDNLQFRFSDRTKVYSGQVFEHLIKNNFIVNSTVVVNKNRLISAGFKFDEDPNLKFVEDYDLWLKLAYNKTEFLYLNDVLTYYYMHENNGSSNAGRTYRSLIIVYKKYALRSNLVIKQLLTTYLRLFYTLIKKKQHSN